MATVKVTDESFDADVLKSSTPVLVDFWAEWCGPCKQIGPALEQIADELSGKVTIAKINIDENPQTPSRYGVRGIPTLMMFKDGKVASTRVGAMPKSKIVEWIDEAASAPSSFPLPPPPPAPPPVRLLPRRFRRLVALALPRAAPTAPVKSRRSSRVGGSGGGGGGAYPLGRGRAPGSAGTRSPPTVVRTPSTKRGSSMSVVSVNVSALGGGGGGVAPER